MLSASSSSGEAMPEDMVNRYAEMGFPRSTVIKALEKLGRTTTFVTKFLALSEFHTQLSL